MGYVLLGITGLIAGVLGGLPGIGGSVIMIPAILMFAGRGGSTHETVHQYQGAAMIGSYLDEHLTHTLPLRIVRIAFVALMLVAAGKMLALVG